MTLRQDRTQLALEHEQIARDAVERPLGVDRYPIPTPILHAYAQIALHYFTQVWNGRCEFRAYVRRNTRSELQRFYSRHSVDGGALARLFSLSFNDQMQLLDLRIQLRRKSRHLLPLRQMILELSTIDGMTDAEIARQLDMTDAEVTSQRVQAETRFSHPRIMGDRYDRAFEKKEKRRIRRKVSPPRAG